MKKSVLAVVSVLLVFSVAGCQYSTRAGNYSIGPGQYIITPGPVDSVRNKREVKLKSIDPRTHEVVIDVWVPPYNIEKANVKHVMDECYRKSRRKALGRITVLDERLFRFPDKTNTEKFRHEHLRTKLHSSENKYKLTHQYQKACLKKLGFRLLPRD